MPNATLQSAAPATRKRHACIDTLPKYVTQNAKMTSHLVTRKRQNEHFVRDFLQISHAEEIFQNTSGSSPPWQRINDTTTTPRRRHDDDTTTPRRRHDEHDANTGPTPDPNYKQEPFAMHSGKRITTRVASSFGSMRQASCDHRNSFPGRRSMDTELPHHQTAKTRSQTTPLVWT